MHSMIIAWDLFIFLGHIFQQNINLMLCLSTLWIKLNQLALRWVMRNLSIQSTIHIYMYTSIYGMIFNSVNILIYFIKCLLS